MGTVHYNGLHWDNPQDDNPKPQFTAGQGFNAVYILASGQISYDPGNGLRTYSTTENNWKSLVSWVKTNVKRTPYEIVLRLYWPRDAANSFPMEGNPGATLGQQFYTQIVKPAMALGVNNFQVLNELNLEYPSKSLSALSGDMYNIAYFIKHQAQIDGIGFVYLGFPGPGGNAGDPVNYLTDWNNYWSAFTGNITHSTDQGNAYNWWGVHAYASNVTVLTTLMERQYDNLVAKIPSLPFRYTEYSIGQIQGNVNWPARADACKNAIIALKTYVAAKNPPGPDIWSVFFWIAYYTAPDSPTAPDYNLVKDNTSTNLAPASNLASAF